MKQVDPGELWRPHAERERDGRGGSSLPAGVLLLRHGGVLPRAVEVGEGRGGEDRVWEREGAGGHWWAGDIVGCAVPPVVGFLLRSRLRHEIAGARAAATATGKDRFK
jgi:hypothetical protein